MTPKNELPNFTIKELREVIPEHCFKRDLMKSFSYVVRDLFCVGVLGYLASFIDSTFVNSEILRWTAWAIYWYLQGAVMTGLWVIAHECGHQAFSDSKAINDAVGWVLHSALLVPYHSWRLSHSAHHKHTGDMNNDTVFLPALRSNVNSDSSPIKNLWTIFVFWFFGWPGYLLFNLTGQKYSRRTNHFEPQSPIFKIDRDFWDVVWSDFGLMLTFGAMFWGSQTYGFAQVVKFYLIPYLWVNFWLVTITYLQHTSKMLPHYRGDQWNFVRGALATINKDYGILNDVFHQIGNTHIAHHLFSTMPHYHAKEASVHLKNKLGKFYLEDNRYLLPMIWECWTQCQYVEDSGKVLWYKTSLDERD